MLLASRQARVDCSSPLELGVHEGQAFLGVCSAAWRNRPAKKERASGGTESPLFFYVHCREEDFCLFCVGEEDFPVCFTSSSKTVELCVSVL